MTAISDYSAAQLTTIKNTVARDTNSQEFDLFMNAARSYGLDPFRKQIIAVVFNKEKKEKRNMVMIVGRDGLRSIAQRCGDYRPASAKPDYTYDDGARGPLNPLGLVSVSVELFKQDKSGTWFPVYGEAYWDEFAPIKDEWGQNEQGNWRPTGKKTLDTSGQWGKMGRVMLTKCAEGQALRAGWPDVFAGIYAEEELDQARAREAKDITPSEEIEQEASHRRQNMLGDRAILMTLDSTGVFQRVPVGQVADRCLEYIKNENAETVYTWSIQNREPLREFWSECPNDALEVKAAIERKTAKVGEAA